MASQDIYTHVFHLYDDDHNGTLDAAECESLFRLLYHTENLPSIVKNQLKSMTSNEAGVITLDAFLTMCVSKKSLFKPIFDLQSRARARSLGENYWASVSKKRVKILNGQKDVFEAARNRLQANQQQSRAPTIKVAPPGIPTRQFSSVTLPVKDLSTGSSADGKTTCAEDGVATKPQEDVKSLGSWVHAESQKEPIVQAYLTAFSQAYVTERFLKEQSQNPSTVPGQDQLLLDLRYSVAVSTKSKYPVELKAIVPQY
ncbi:hypothetical protein V7S43_005951 [Phytophthora oleae]|uniref:EF-hand domain-containing protein n=1 Tax=Phytophthora oleae TaxID=2107226 RepID=A0ABD3FQH7_9STRA